MPVLNYLINPVRAVQKVGRMAHNLYWDLRYGGYCGGYQRSRYEDCGGLATQSTEYGQLKLLFDQDGVTIRASDVLVDVGCGKGRVLNYWLSRGWRNRMIGIELDPAIADQTRRRLQPYPNITIVTGNILDTLPLDGTLFYLFYPFTTPVMKRFKDRLAQQSRARDSVRILYYNCADIDVFQNDTAWEVTELAGQAELFFPAALIRLRPSLRASKNVSCNHG
jgi:SAM-dependent methyltransferase